MSEWITAREAAEILGAYPSNLPKMRRRGELAKRPNDERPVYDRAQVEALPRPSGGATASKAASLAPSAVARATAARHGARLAG